MKLRLLLLNADDDAASKFSPGGASALTALDVAKTSVAGVSNGVSPV